MKFSPILVHKRTTKGLSGQQQKIMNNYTLPSETSHSNQEEAPKIPIDDRKQKRSQLDEYEIKQEPDDMREHPSSSHEEEEERISSFQNENHSDILIQTSSPNLDCFATSEKKAVEKLQPRRNPETGCRPSQSDQLSLIIPFGVPLTQFNRKSFSYLTKAEKLEKLQPRRNPELAVVQDSQFDAENNPSIRVFEKGSDNGYNWRKYGQKLVKGNKFIRSYYKCTYLNCQAKKQVEKSHNGSQTETNFLGSHLHPKPQNSPQVNSIFQARLSDVPTLTVSKSDAEPIMEVPGTLLVESTVATSVDDGVTESVLFSNNDDKDAKRMKREVMCADENVVSRPNKYLRHVVQTPSEVGIVNDGYRWRKYGQKFVKGNPNPRSYYRCSSGGCPVKKHVERASHDPKVVTTTYEGQHDHEIPPCRSANQSNTTTTAINNSIMIGEPRPKPDEPPVVLDMVVHVSSK